MAEYYTLQIAGLTRKLKRCRISDQLEIAAFILFSDVELTEACAKELAKKCQVCDYDYILTAECKGIPLAYELSRQTGKPYVVARKSVKGYMTDSISVAVHSITTAAPQTLYLDGEKAGWLHGKRVLLVDDVISTGESIAALEALTRQAGGIIAGKAAVLAEGDAMHRSDLIYLAPLPLFEVQS